MKTDADLLRSYLDAQSEPAFTELVQRHIGLVYSVALRRLGGDAHLAEDVTQTVFNDLARKASGLRERATLGGWLYLSTNLASAAAVRSERRRKAREISAHDMQHTLASAESVSDWNQLRPVIDDAIVELKEEDREAVVLRFFDKRSFPEVGAALHVTEEAARKRVDRALEKLRAILQRRGVSSTAAALGVALTSVAATSTPAGLGAKVAGQAMATAGVSSGGITLTGWLGVALPMAAALVAGGLVLFERRANEKLRGELGRYANDRAALTSLQKENHALARRLADVDALRRTAAEPLPELPRRGSVAPSMTAVARPISSRISITAAGTVQWNNDFVSLAEFISRLRQIKAKADPESRLLVRADGSNYSAIMWVIDEARKAGIEHLTVEGRGKPEQQFPFSWF